MSVMESEFYAGPPLEVEYSDPLQALAERAWFIAKKTHEYGAEVAAESACFVVLMMKVPPKLIIKFIDEYKVDGVIMHSTRSCRVQSFGQRHIAGELRKLGIPMISFESDMADPRLWSDNYVKNQLDGFIAMLESAQS